MHGSFWETWTITFKKKRLECYQFWIESEHNTVDYQDRIYAPAERFLYVLF